jgi:hypothetical protein
MHFRNVLVKGKPLSLPALVIETRLKLHQRLRRQERFTVLLTLWSPVAATAGKSLNLTASLS